MEGGGGWQLIGQVLPAMARFSAGFIGASVLSCGFAALPAYGECLTLVSGPVVYDVAGCTLVDPEKTFDASKDKYKFIADMDAAGRKQFLDSYRGLYLKGKVVKSSAMAKGMTGEQGALGGEQAYVLIPPPLGGTQCSHVLGKRLEANLRERCCDGGGETPCLLNTGFLLSRVKIIGSADSGAGDALRQRSARSKDYQAAEKFFLEKRYKLAAASYEKARANGELDVKGQYFLGQSYREIDQCRDAIEPLRGIYDAHLKKQIWADDEKYARPAIFLLARCYAKMNDPSPAVLVLNSYLLEPQKYKNELVESLKHKDFGWIHTSREYRDYMKAANKKLASLKK